MKRKDIITLRFKIVKFKSKNGLLEEPDWASMEAGTKFEKTKYNTETSYIKRTFEKEGIISIEENDETTSVLNHEEGTFIVQKRFKKLFKLIYKK